MVQVLLPRIRSELAPKRGLGGQGWLLERPKVRAKSMQNLLGHNAAWRGRSLQARSFERSGTP